MNSHEALIERLQHTRADGKPVNPDGEAAAKTIEYLETRIYRLGEALEKVLTKNEAAKVEADEALTNYYYN